MLVFNKLALNATVSSAVNSQVVDISGIRHVSIQAIYVGTLVATIALQGSNDGNNFADISNASISVSSNGNSIINLPSLACCYIRARVTTTSGTSDLLVYITGKE